jgi:hypothetical protein
MLDGYSHGQRSEALAEEFTAALATALETSVWLPDAKVVLRGSVCVTRRDLGIRVINISQGSGARSKEN